MSTLQLTFGCGDYDRTRPLTDGTVSPEGIELSWVHEPVPHELFVKVLDGEYDVAEMSFSGLNGLISAGKDELVGLPVFTSRLFRHSFVYVNPDSGIEKPADLVGRRVGVPDYTVTAAVWIRGFLQHDYDVHPTSLKWFLGGLDRPGPVRAIGRRPPGVQLESIPDDRTLSEMLVAGELDAIVAPGQPRCFKERSPHVRRLFPHYQEVEADYYKRTGIVPIMHTAILRRRVYEANRWAAWALYDAFCQAKELCLRRLGDTGAPKTSLTWLQVYLEREREVFGPDPWPYGLEPNRKTVEALIAYSHEQGLTDRMVPAEGLFAEETVA